MYITTYRRCDELPPKFDTAFADARSGSLFCTRPWLDAFARSGVDAGARLRLYAIESDGAPLALLPAIVAYLALALDLIPDFVPVLGQIDDVLVVTAGLGLFLRLTPRHVIERHLGVEG